MDDAGLSYPRPWNVYLWCWVRGWVLLHLGMEAVAGCGFLKFRFLLYFLSLSLVVVTGLPEGGAGR